MSHPQLTSPRGSAATTAARLSHDSGSNTDKCGAFAMEDVGVTFASQEEQKVPDNDTANSTQIISRIQALHRSLLTLPPWFLNLSEVTPDGKLRAAENCVVVIPIDLWIKACKARQEQLGTTTKNLKIDMGLHKMMLLLEDIQNNRRSPADEQPHIQHRCRNLQCRNCPRGRSRLCKTWVSSISPVSLSHHEGCLCEGVGHKVAELQCGPLLVIPKDKAGVDALIWALDDHARLVPTNMILSGHKKNTKARPEPEVLPNAAAGSGGILIKIEPSTPDLQDSFDVTFSSEEKPTVECLKGLVCQRLPQSVNEVFLWLKGIPYLAPLDMTLQDGWIFRYGLLRDGPCKTMPLSLGPIGPNNFTIVTESASSASTDMVDDPDVPIDPQDLMPPNPNELNLALPWQVGLPSRSRSTPQYGRDNAVLVFPSSSLSQNAVDDAAPLVCFEPEENKTTGVSPASSSTAFPPVRREIVDWQLQQHLSHIEAAASASIDMMEDLDIQTGPDSDDKSDVALSLQFALPSQSRSMPQAHRDNTASDGKQSSSATLVSQSPSVTQSASWHALHVASMVCNAPEENKTTRVSPASGSTAFPPVLREIVNRQQLDFSAAEYIQHRHHPRKCRILMAPDCLWRGQGLHTEPIAVGRHMLKHPGMNWIIKTSPLDEKEIIANCILQSDKIDAKVQEAAQDDEFDAGGSSTDEQDQTPTDRPPAREAHRDPIRINMFCYKDGSPYDPVLDALKPLSQEYILHVANQLQFLCYNTTDAPLANWSDLGVYVRAGATMMAELTGDHIPVIQALQISSDNYWILKKLDFDYEDAKIYTDKQLAFHRSQASTHQQRPPEPVMKEIRELSGLGKPPFDQHVGLKVPSFLEMWADLQAMSEHQVGIPEGMMNLIQVTSSSRTESCAVTVFSVLGVIACIMQYEGIRVVRTEQLKPWIVDSNNVVRALKLICPWLSERFASRRIVDVSELVRSLLKILPQDVCDKYFRLLPELGWIMDPCYRVMLSFARILMALRSIRLPNIPAADDRHSERSLIQALCTRRSPQEPSPVEVVLSVLGPLWGTATGDDLVVSWLSDFICRKPTELMLHILYSADDNATSLNSLQWASLFSDDADAAEFMQDLTRSVAAKRQRAARYLHTKILQAAATTPTAGFGHVQGHESDIIWSLVLPLLINHRALGAYLPNWAAPATNCVTYRVSCHAWRLFLLQDEGILNHVNLCVDVTCGKPHCQPCKINNAEVSVSTAAKLQEYGVKLNRAAASFDRLLPRTSMPPSLADPTRDPALVFSEPGLIAHVYARYGQIQTYHQQQNYQEVRLIVTLHRRRSGRFDSCPIKREVLLHVPVSSLVPGDPTLRGDMLYDPQSTIVRIVVWIKGDHKLFVIQTTLASDEVKATSLPLTTSAPCSDVYVTADRYTGAVAAATGQELWVWHFGKVQHAAHKLALKPGQEVTGLQMRRGVAVVSSAKCVYAVQTTQATGLKSKLDEMSIVHKSTEKRHVTCFSLLGPAESLAVGDAEALPSSTHGDSAKVLFYDTWGPDGSKPVVLSIEEEEVYESNHPIPRSGRGVPVAMTWAPSTNGLIVQVQRTARQSLQMFYPLSARFGGVVCRPLPERLLGMGVQDDQLYMCWSNAAPAPVVVADSLIRMTLDDEKYVPDAAITSSIAHSFGALRPASRPPVWMPLSADKRTLAHPKFGISRRASGHIVLLSKTSRILEYDPNIEAPVRVFKRPDCWSPLTTSCLDDEWVVVSCVGGAQYLVNMCTNDYTSLPRQHRDDVCSSHTIWNPAGFSSNDWLLVSADMSGTVVVAVLSKHQDSFMYRSALKYDLGGPTPVLAVDPNGRFAVTGSQVSDAFDGKICVVPLVGPRGAYSIHQNHLLVSEMDWKCRSRNASGFGARPIEIAYLTGSFPRSLAVSHDGIIASGWLDGCVRLYKVEDHHLQQQGIPQHVNPFFVDACHLGDREQKQTDTVHMICAWSGECCFFACSSMLGALRPAGNTYVWEVICREKTLTSVLDVLSMPPTQQAYQCIATGMCGKLVQVSLTNLGQSHVVVWKRRDLLLSPST